MAMRVSGINSGLDTEALVTELVSAYSKKTEKYEKEQTKVSWKQDAWKDLNAKVYSLYTNISNLRYSGAYSTKKATSSNTAKATITASSNSVVGTQKLRVLSTAQTSYLTGSKLQATDSDTTISETTTLEQLGVTAEKSSFIIKTKDENGNDVENTIEVGKASKLSDVLNQLKEKGVNANFDSATGRIFVSGKDSGEKYDFEIKAVEDDTDSASLVSALGLSGGDSHMIHGTDAEIRLSGVLYKSNSNNFSVNGLNIEVNGTTGDTEDNEITLTVATDTQAIYDKIKDFLTEYNELMNEMTKLYNAESAGEYEPLTDDEKSAMSDTQIEKWETKIKDSLLRRDTTLSSLMSTMQNAMYSSVTVNGQKMSLSSFGIHTLGFLGAAENEQNAYHIDGDEDDSATSGNKDKLMAAITEDPDSVVEFMKQLTTNLYKNIDTKMKSTSMSSAYTVYNDKELKSQYDSLTKTIKKWEERVSDQEDYYYKKFTAMEKALANLNSQQSSVSGLFQN